VLHVLKLVLVQQEELPAFRAAFQQEVGDQVLEVSHLPGRIDLSQVLNVDRVKLDRREDVGSKGYGHVLALSLLRVDGL
jgi:hypothetical protein